MDFKLTNLQQKLLNKLMEQARFFGLEIDEDGSLVQPSVKKVNYWDTVNEQSDRDPRIDMER